MGVYRATGVVTSQPTVVDGDQNRSLDISGLMRHVRSHDVGRHRVSHDKNTFIPEQVHVALVAIGGLMIVTAVWLGIAVYLTSRVL